MVGEGGHVGYDSMGYTMGSRYDRLQLGYRFRMASGIRDPAPDIKLFFSLHSHTSLCSLFYF